MAISHLKIYKTLRVCCKKISTVVKQHMFMKPKVHRNCNIMGDKPDERLNFSIRRERSKALNEIYLVARLDIRVKITFSKPYGQSVIEEHKTVYKICAILLW